MPRPSHGEDEQELEAGQGLPDVAAQLGKDAFVPLETRRLAKARILWVNWALLEDMGIKVPAGGLTPEFEEHLLKTFAYGVPQPKDPASAFTSETRTFYADKYGGTGMGASQGSGRAASRGQFQTKGIGRTSLAEAVHPKTFAFWNFMGAYGHQHGGLAFREAVTEAIWGELLHAELPYGANRVAFVISTGTSTQWFGPFKEPRALIVRENAIRPAHFMGNWQLENIIRGAPEAADVRRRKPLALKLVGMLPASPKEEGRKLSEGERLNLRLLQMSARWGSQFGSQYAKSLLHSAVTPSNLQIDGKMLDYGTMTSLDGYPRAIVARGANGDLTALKDDVLYALFDDLRKILPSHLSGAIPTKEDGAKAMEEGFKTQVHKEFLWLAGVPPELITQLQNSPEAWALTDELINIAKSGNETIKKITYGVDRNTGTYDLEKVLAALVAGNPKEPAIFLDHLKAAGLDAAVAGELIKAYSAFQPLLTQEALQNGLTNSSLHDYQMHAVTLRNRKLVDLFRGHRLQSRLKANVNEFISTKNPAVIRDFIESSIHDNQRTFSDTPPFSVVLEEKNLPEKDSRLRRIFDATTGETKLHIELKVANASVGEVLSLRLDGEPAISAAVVSTDKGRARLAIKDRPLGGLEVEIASGSREKIAFTIAKTPTRPGLVLRCWTYFSQLLPRT